MSTTYLSGPSSGVLRTSGISAVTIVNSGCYLGSAITNSTNLDNFADVELVWQYAVAPVVNNYLKLHFLFGADATNYEEGSGDGTTVITSLPLPGCLIGIVSPPVDTTQHRKFLSFIPIPPFDFKPLLENANTGQMVSGVSLNVYTRKDQIVG